MTEALIIQFEIPESDLIKLDQGYMQLHVWIVFSSKVRPHDLSQVSSRKQQ